MTFSPSDVKLIALLKNDLGFDKVFDLFSAYKLGEIQKLPKMKERVVFIFFYGEIETEVESGLLQKTINKLNKLLITFLRSFEQNNFYCQKVMPLLIFDNISYFGHNSS